MSHRMVRVVAAIAVLAACVPAASADTLRLKNGGELEGVIEREDAAMIELNVGFGSIAVQKTQVGAIERSSADELKALYGRWDEKRRQLQAEEGALTRAREERLAEYETWIREEHEKKIQEEVRQKQIALQRDILSKSVSVDALLNGKVHATLVVDTGASIVVLSKQVSESLGLDLGDTKRDIVTLQLAGSHKIQAKAFFLESVKIQDVEVKHVMAAALLEEADTSGFKDGLLGMTFLSQFNLKFDLKDMKMTLEKLD